MSESDLLNIFRDEVSEYLEALNSALLQVEIIAADDAAYRATLIEMNRIAHSMKGAARAVGISLIETISHYMEEVFGAALNHRLKLTPDTCDTLYDGIDLIQNVMQGDDADDDALTQVLMHLEQVVAGSSAVDSQVVKVVPAIQVDALLDEDFLQADEPLLSPLNPPLDAPINDNAASTPLNTASTPLIEAQTIAMRPAEETVRVTVSKLDRLMAESTELLVARMHGEQQYRAVSDLRRVHGRWQREWRSVRAAYIRMVRRVQDTQDSVPPELLQLLKFVDSNQRYISDINRRLGQLAQTIAQDNMHFAALSDQLQDDIGSMRLVPFDFIVGSFQRTVRDLSREMGKQITLEINGLSVEIDKTVLDALKDPLMHLIRNAIDHGIEAPRQRELAGKSASGHIRIDVQQHGSEMILSVSDDGRGIDVARVRQSIVRQKLLTEGEVQLLNDDEARFYVFHPGLSTSDQVTAVSGRGIGMDVVRDRIESLRGRISLTSEAGKGTTVTMNVPVSLTRIRCILLRVGEQAFAIPSVVVMRMQTITRDAIFWAEGQEMTVINSQPVPCVSLGAILNIPAAPEANASDEVHLMVLQIANRMVAFEVDSLSGEQELVLKPLGRELERALYVSGAALLGSGDVVIVLDANDLVRAATGFAFPRRKATAAPVVSTQPRRVRVLVVDDSITTRTLEKNILETAGFEVHVAMDGSEAWQVLGEMAFDLVISDVEMPRMNGLELAARIKQSDEYRHLPVILLTSLSKPEQREAGLRAGADAYLVKSQFDQGELLETIQSVL